MVLALGNDLLCDDGVGFAVVRRLRPSFSEAEVEFVESGESGLALLELIVGYEAVVIVDALVSGVRPAGSVIVMDSSEFCRVIAPSAHYAGLAEVMDLGHRLGLPMPSRITVVGIEVEDPYSFSPSLTPAVEAAVESAAQVVVSLLPLEPR